MTDCTFKSIFFISNGGPLAQICYKSTFKYDSSFTCSSNNIIIIIITE